MTSQAFPRLLILNVRLAYLIKAYIIDPTSSIHSELQKHLVEIDAILGQSETQSKGEWDSFINVFLSELNAKNFESALRRLELFIPLNYLNKPLLQISISKLELFKSIYSEDNKNVEKWKDHLFSIMNSYGDHYKNSIKTIEELITEPAILKSHYYKNIKEIELVRLIRKTFKKSIEPIKSMSLSQLTKASIENYCLISKENFKALNEFELSLKTKYENFKLEKPPGTEDIDTFLTKKRMSTIICKSKENNSKNHFKPQGDTLSCKENEPNNQNHEGMLVNNSNAHDNLDDYNNTKNESSKPANTSACYKKVVLPSIKSFNFRILKRENINKMVISKFKKHLTALPSNTESGETVFKFLSIGFPPCEYKGNIFRSFNTKYLQLLFSISGIKPLFEEFMLNSSETIHSNLCSSYNVNLEEEVRILHKYLKEFVDIFQ